MPRAANEAQRRHWNDDVRFVAWRRREPLTAAVTATLLRHAGLVSGERVLDVGCGGGRTTIAAARQIGPDFGALGADISEPLVTLARQRAETAGLTNARFTAADVQVADLDGAPFDAAISQFGVMFFDETVTAFANIRAHVRPGGRLTIVCWQALADNPWFAGESVRQFIPPEPGTGPGQNAVGPFTLADPEYATGVLAEAGWSAVDRTPYRQGRDGRAPGPPGRRCLPALSRRCRGPAGRSPRGMRTAPRSAPARRRPLRRPAGIPGLHRPQLSVHGLDAIRRSQA